MEQLHHPVGLVRLVFGRKPLLLAEPSLVVVVLNRLEPCLLYDPASSAFSEVRFGYVLLLDAVASQCPVCVQPVQLNCASFGRSRGIGVLVSPQSHYSSQVGSVEVPDSQASVVELP